VLVLLMSAACAGAMPRHAAAASPVDVTAAFYHWYVDKFRSDHDPMLELRAESAGRISATLLGELDAQLVDGMSDQDYFLQADDVVRPCHSVDAALSARARDSAQVEVTLGSRSVRPWRVRVSLVKEGDAWRILQVAREARPPASGASKRAMSDC
jgi:hypothetical protein